MDQNMTENGKGKTPMIAGGIILLAVLLGGYYILNSRGNPRETAAVQEVQTEATAAIGTSSVSGLAEDGSVKTITMDAGSFYYSVKEIMVKKGEKVKIIMTSKDMMHDFNIDELNVDGPIAKSGETVTMEFTADKAGTFEYYCSVGQHRQNGQVGKIIIEE